MKTTEGTWDDDNVDKCKIDCLDVNDQLEGGDDLGDAHIFQSDIYRLHGDGLANEYRARETLQDERFSFLVEQAEFCEDPGDRITLLHGIEACNSFRNTDLLYFKNRRKWHMRTVD